jgi:predicted TIM-barrel fold metal-dependent hydrolase
MSTFGSGRIAWGSNFPAVADSFPALVAEAREVLSILPPGDQENIFWRTAASLYPALAGQ